LERPDKEIKTCFCLFSQAQVPGSTTSTVLKNLLSDTEYTVTVVPVYAPGEGKRMSENGKTCEFMQQLLILARLESKKFSHTDPSYTPQSHKKKKKH